MIITAKPSALAGSVTIPPSKSAAHRMIIAAALAKGKSVIRNVDLSSDIRATIDACKNLGCEIDILEGSPYHTIEIDGGMHISKHADIDCGESGSALRFFIPVACALAGSKTFTGSAQLPMRPIDAYYDIFKAQGIAYTKPDDKNLPLTVDGTLSPGQYSIDGGVSSQYITGLLYALPLLNGDSVITVTGKFESKGYVDMTLRVLRDFGIEVTQTGNEYFVHGNQTYQPGNHRVDGDYSQAAFFLVGGAISGEVTLHELREDSLQPDRAVVDILRRMGADIRRDGNTLVAGLSELKGVTIDVSQCPDLVPPLAVAAAYASGQTHITGAARLRIKESDRLQTVAEGLQRLGIQVRELPDGLVINGGPAGAGTVDSYEDHRITMAFSMAALGANGEVRITGAEAINKSYPNFFKDYRGLGGEIL